VLSELAGSQYLRQLLSRTKGISVDIIWLFLGKALALAANASMLVVLGRQLQTGPFGTVIAAIGAEIVVSRVLLFGTDVGTFRLQTLEPQWRPHLRGASLLLLLGATAVGTVLAAICTLPAAVRLLPGPRWVGPVVLAGASGMVLHDYVYWTRLADYGYRSAGLLAAAVAGTRATIVIIALMAAGVRDAYSLLITMAVVPLTISSVLLLRNRPKLTGLPRTILVKLLRYCGWQAASNIIGTLTLQQGTLVLSLLRRPADAAIFGLAITLGTAAILVTQSVQEFLISRALRFGRAHDIKRFLSKALALTSAIASLLFFVLLGAFSLMGLLFRSRLPVSMTVFFPIALAIAILLLHAPFETVCHMLSRPHDIVLSKSLRLIVGLVLGVVWGSKSGAAGAAAALLISTVISLVALVVLTLWNLTSRPSNRKLVEVEV
jgi:O-antigen/teichoic acid export membrane protein